MKASHVRRWIAAALGAAVVFGMGAAAPATAAIAGDVVITGHGFGHGRGLSQYGSLGYAVDYGWGYRQILDHYYGGTVAGSAPNDEITVELMSSRATDPVILGQQVYVNGVFLGDVAVKVRRQGPGEFAFDVGSGCGGPFTSASGVVASGLSVYTSAVPDANGVLKVCQPDGSARGYHGYFQVFEGSGFSALVNRVPIENYLLGVVPRESPASWGSAGGGKGINALRAQAVAARSYALAGGWTSYAKTCDTTQCQVYGGTNVRAANGTITSSEHPYTNQAVRDTAGEIRRNSGGGVVRAEFNSSSGGWTAGGDFPAVQDLGDGTASNPNRNWNVVIDAGTLAQKLGTAPINAITINSRNGLGAEGGRVLNVAVDTTSGRVNLTGNQFRSRLGLKSDWFSVSYAGMNYAASVSFVRALYTDILKRTGGEGEVAGWANAVVAGADRSNVARSFVNSRERLNTLVDQAYMGALQRHPEPQGQENWVNFLSGGATLNDLNAAVYGSLESVMVLGGGDNALWVDGMYLGILGRSAGPSERAYWIDMANRQSRGFVAWNISASVEARERRLNGYYLEFLGRTVDQTGVRTWVPAMTGRGDFDVQVFIAGSAEYYDRARVRFP